MAFVEVLECEHLEGVVCGQGSPDPVRAVRCLAVPCALDEIHLGGTLLQPFVAQLQTPQPAKPVGTIEPPTPDQAGQSVVKPLMPDQPGVPASDPLAGSAVEESLNAQAHRTGQSHQNSDHGAGDLLQLAAIVGTAEAAVGGYVVGTLAAAVTGLFISPVRLYDWATGQEQRLGGNMWSRVWSGVNTVERHEIDTALGRTH
jgi:hypothetical protein